MSSGTQPFVPHPFRDWPKGAEVKTFKGSCHCGGVTLEYDHPALEERPPVSCNCKMCTRYACLYIYGPESALHLTRGEPSTFLSRGKDVNFYFCHSCGCMLCWTGWGRSGANVRMFDGVKVDKLVLEYHDGAHLVYGFGGSHLYISLIETAPMSSTTQTTEPTKDGDAPTQLFKGTCHCRKFAFEYKHAPLDVKKAARCNCSWCARTGGIYIMGPENMLTLDPKFGGWDDFTKFENKTKTVKHYFCPVCGNLMFWTGMDLLGVNVRMLDGVDADNLEVEIFDGKNLL
ncbi:uncharacterized protein FOMMEDRAFT_165994 [Fomitiporia mediterranea MF3/22]|uniref:uncharacterized protein n=1 Tax=Fomitiporia mediterranea (strain MF3/22) TaxID=694068 RepID=UPI0004409448|nr:uncharacterized protein FOMMEDRAFT_165994 [Fomitiporia mediterranea MF3/22]EJD05618.1 hypothetical protein FOMMEDRAFT_165994 [Fomitiporia mediterranea MF3/22]